MPAVHRREVVTPVLRPSLAWALADPVRASGRRVRQRPSAFPQGVAADPTPSLTRLGTGLAGSRSIVSEAARAVPAQDVDGSDR